MSMLDEIARVLERARVAGGWIDEDVARQVMEAMKVSPEPEPVVLEGEVIEADGPADR